MVTGTGAPMGRPEGPQDKHTLDTHTEETSPVPLSKHSVAVPSDHT